MEKIVSVVGARPQFVKLAPISRAFARLDHAVVHRIVHTGQHYDHNMSAVFFEELEIPNPDIDLGVGSGKHGAQTGAMLAALEAEFETDRPSAVFVYGDTNSTLAATLAATKLHVPVVHVEAGLRSFDRRMPEEVNRLVADHCADRLYAPTDAGMANLTREGLAERALLSGDVMLDALRHNVRLAAERSTVRERFSLDDGEYGIVTIHRPANTDSIFLGQLIEVLEQLADSAMPLILPLHPRTCDKLKGTGGLENSSLILTPPLSYVDMLHALTGARIVVTDSGGLQKEAAFVGIPCITLRNETEWTETVDMGANTLVGRNTGKLVDEFNRILGSQANDWSTEIAEYYGNGEAAKFIVEDALKWLGGQ